jgi:hypothetical protein
MNLEQEYIRLRNTPSDINEHMAMLKNVGSIYHHITEMGVRYGVSTTAFLAGRPKTLISYDIRCQINVPAFQEMAQATEFIFVEADTLDVDIAYTDVLFIDTLHTAEQLSAELERHQSSVRSQIILHDTVTFGETGEDGKPGLMKAVREFIYDHPRWEMTHHYINNNGLMFLSKKGG